MNIAAYVAAGLSVICGVLSGLFNRLNRPMARTSFKTLGSALFIATALMAYASRGFFAGYFMLVLVALIGGMLGDIFLSVDKLVIEKYRPYFMAIGASCFAVGHIMFAVIFLTVAGAFNYWLLFLLIGFPLLFIVVSTLSKFKFGKLRIGMYAYSFFLALMLVSGVNMYITARSSASILVLVASILFVLSDSIMAFKKFTDNEQNPIHIYSILITYYVAQNLFALTILLH